LDFAPSPILNEKEDLHPQVLSQVLADRLEYKSPIIDRQSSISNQKGYASRSIILAAMDCFRRMLSIG